MDEPDWIIEQTKARKRKEMLRQREEMEARLMKIRAREKLQQEIYFKGEQPHKKRKTDARKSDDGDEDQYVLDDYDSDRDNAVLSAGHSANGLSAATMELLAKLGTSLSAPREEEELDDEIKVHSSHT